MKTITLETSDELADRFSTLTQNEKNDLADMINLLIEDNRSLREVMDDMGEYARRRGLTPALLDEPLKKK